MSESRTGREQRSAAKLRENLKRRKEQARARSATAGKQESVRTSPEDAEVGDALKPGPDSDS